MGIDCGDRLQGSIAGIDCGNRLQGSIAGIDCRDRLRGSIAGIDCGGSIAGERGREIAGSDEKFLEFFNGKCGREIEIKKVRDL